MGMQIARRGTTVLVLTSDAGLIRLARSILEPACTVIGRALPGANEGDIAEQTDIVIIDVEFSRSRCDLDSEALLHGCAGHRALPRLPRG